MIAARWSVVAALCGCGRIGFDARQATGDAASADAAGDGGSGGFVIVQSKLGTTTITTTVTVSINATTAGNLIVVLAGTTAGHMITSITDDANNLYVAAGVLASDVNSGESDYWYAANANGGVTAVTLTSDSSDAAGFIYEIAGASRIAPLAHKSALSNQSAATLVIGAPLTTTAAGELILTNADVQFDVIGTHTGNVFSNDAPLMDTDGAAHYVATHPGAYGAAWDQDAAGTYATSSVSFNPAP